jgi:hypothetical protein
MLSLPQYTKNRLLPLSRRLSLSALKPNLELVHLPLGDVLCESGGRLSYVYFPTSSIISFTISLKMAHRPKSQAWETRACWAYHSSWVGTRPQLGDGANRRRRLSHEVADNGPGIQCRGDLFSVYCRYAQALITQISQTAVCKIAITR